MTNWTHQVKKYFDSKSLNYDKSHFNDKSIRALFEKNRFNAVNDFLDRGEKLLDVACGTGYYLASLKDSYNCFGTDLSEGMLVECEKKGITQLSIANFESLPFSDNTFDVIICVNAFQYSQSPLKAIKEMQRVLSPNGTLLITFWNFSSLRNYLGRFISIFKALPSIEQKHRFHTRGKIEKLVLQSEMVLCDIKYYNFGPWKLSSNLLSNDLFDFFVSIERKGTAFFFNFLSSEFIVKLKKI